MSRIGSRIEEFQIAQYRFDKWFTVGPVLEVLPFGNAPLSACILGNAQVRAAATELGPALDVAVLGWHDHAALVWPFESDAPSALQEGALHLHAFRPYEGGDAALLVTNAEWLDFLLVDISFEDERIEFSRLHREPIPNPSYRLDPTWRAWLAAETQRKRAR